jgi:succinate-acetate transporter protein
MASIDHGTQPVVASSPAPGGPAPASAVAWGNSAPLALAGFATTTFMLSMINANLVTGYGAFWLSLFAIGLFFIKEVPVTQVGHALGLFLYAFGIFTVVMLAASLRTSVAVVTTLLLLGVTFFVLGAGNYSASSGLIKTGGWIGLVVAAGAFYLALAEVCEASYGRMILPLGSLAKK